MSETSKWEALRKHLQSLADEEIPHEESYNELLVHMDWLDSIEAAPSHCTEAELDQSSFGYADKHG